MDKVLQELIEKRKILDKEISDKKEHLLHEERERAEKKREAIPEEYLLQCMQHDRTSCSDEQPGNAYFDSAGNYKIRCRKCAFIQLLNGELGNNFDFNISVDVFPVAV